MRQKKLFMVILVVLFVGLMVSALTFWKDPCSTGYKAKSS